VKRNANELVIGTVKLNSALPIKRKNQTLPVRLITSGMAYFGFRSKSTTPKKAPRTFDLNQLDLTEGESRIGCGGGECVRAAARMKGVVKPHAIPMRRKPMMYRNIDGAGSGEGAVSMMCE